MEQTIIDLFLKFFATFIAIYGFAVIQKSPKKYVMVAALVGGISGFVYWVCVAFGTSDVLSSFFSALMAAMLSHVFARVYKVPVTLFLVGGIIPTVPGAGIYHTVYNFIMQNEELTAHYLTQTLQTAGVIALAVFIVDSLFSSSRRGFWLLEEMDHEDAY